MTDEASARRASGAGERRLTRPRDGRWIAGVCAALAEYSGWSAARTRLAFAAATPILGAGILAYLVGWLVMPSEGSSGRRRRPTAPGALAGLVLIFGGALALLTVALASALATVFGFGWGVLVVSAAVLATGLVWLRGLSPGWVLLPLAGLVLPAAAMIAAGARLPAVGNVSATPTGAAELQSSYRGGIGTSLIDLRHYRFAAGAAARIRIHAGIGRTVVALPHDRCVAVRIDYHTHSGLLSAVGRTVGVGADDAPEVSVFGRALAGGRGQVSVAAGARRPMVSIDYRSQGGALVVRDYPATIDPGSFYDWPGELFALGPRPRRGQLSRRDFESELSAYNTVRREQRRIAAQLPGPCDRGSRR